MGAKSPEPMTLRRQQCVCDICDRQFMTASALISHKKFRHNFLTPAAKRAFIEASGHRAGKKRSSMTPVAKKSGKMTPSKTVTHKAASEGKKDRTVKKIEFKCPKCVRIFSVYFSAYRHIQKHHCVDENDEPVAPNSISLIKPIRVELCQTCHAWTRPTETHVCKQETQATSENYTCIGCQVSFKSLLLFETHVKELHSSNAERMFFPTHFEFTSWRKELEETTKVKFNTFTKDKSHQIYHCSPPTLDVENNTPLCPSSLCVTEFKSGYQVFYYKEHVGHTCPDLPTQKYKKYSLEHFFKDYKTEDSVYGLFKSVMEGVISNAVNLDIKVLNTLLGKAYDMAHVLNNIGEATDPLVVKKNMSDDQITEVLAEVKTYTNKRKAESDKDGKKAKISDENEENMDKKFAEVLLPAPRAVLISPTPSSFNDSYKDFIESSLPNSNSSTPKRALKTKKEVVKTKIGQFKTRASLSPKTPEAPKIVKETDESTKDFKETPKTVKNVSKTMNIVTKEVVKVRPKFRPSFASRLKPDFEYVVKERENDCNILILKI